MRYFLLVLDQGRGVILHEEEFADGSSSLQARFRIEREKRFTGDIEVIVLGASSREVLQQTHARYFQTVGQLIHSAARLLREQAA
ncbi:hypothetical protein [Actinoplanes rectilineatus]|uniref:hypothetical protein n=1 Tax=Actinoplanes rectilineatus TaxID=113571 RepID=UPI0005F28FC1|nr:hypothetical protein [Actinoplanes rectilineatus]